MSGLNAGLSCPIFCCGSAADQADFNLKIKIELAVRAKMAEKIVSTIREAARSASGENKREAAERS